MCFVVVRQITAHYSKVQQMYSIIRQIFPLLENFNMITELYKDFFVMKTSLGALSKNFVGIELDLRITLGSVTLFRVKSNRVTAIWIGDRYMRQKKLFTSITKNIVNIFLYVAVSRVILIRYLISHSCVVHGTYYEFYLKN